MVDKEYIDLRVLLLKIDLHGTNKFGMLDEDIRKFVKSIPAADVVEVKHGYWKWEIKIEPQAQNRLYCSVCDNECLSKGNYYVESNWCPHCGAKMDAKAPTED